MITKSSFSAIRTEPFGKDKFLFWITSISVFLQYNWFVQSTKRAIKNFLFQTNAIVGSNRQLIAQIDNCRLKSSVFVLSRQLLPQIDNCRLQLTITAPNFTFQLPVSIPYIGLETKKTVPLFCSKCFMNVRLF